MHDATGRFSNRVDSYVKYRPDYPVALERDLVARGVWRKDATWADVGAGTGIWTRQIAPWVGRVIALEPNAPMRAAGETFLADVANASLRDGSAEATGLPDQSCDGITAAQAFHWFDRVAFRAECERVLRPGGTVLLVWNERIVEVTPFARDYEALLLEHGTDYAAVDHRRMTPEVLAEFFGAGGFTTVEHPHAQYFDLAGLEGRVLSSSYAPPPGHPRHAGMMEALRELFVKHAEEGRLAFDYVTRAYFGTVAGG